MEEKLKELEKEIQSIKDRNTRVESDKSWEISLTRIISVSLITYITTALVLYIIGTNNYLLGALVPTVGFILSTQTLPFIRKIWNKSRG